VLTLSGATIDTQFVADHLTLLIGSFIGLLVVLSLAFGFGYRTWVRVPVGLHFGEEYPSRRDRAASARRRAFEWLCGQAMACVYFSGVAGTMSGFLSDRVAQLAHWAMAIQVGLLLIAGLLVWAAVNRWRAPFED
jgi:hypothetical protein